jgi:hypothetical protein
VGTDADPDKYMTAADNQPKRAAAFYLEGRRELSAEETVKVFVSPDGATVGAGAVRLFYVKV